MSNIGDLIWRPAGIDHQSIIFSDGSEFLRTGSFKAYSNKYSNLVQQSRLFGSIITNHLTTSGASAAYDYYYISGNYVCVQLSTSVVAAVNYGSTPSFGSPATGTLPNFIYDSALFGSSLLTCGQTSSAGPVFSQSSTGRDFSVASGAPANDTFVGIAAGESIAIALRTSGSTNSGDIYVFNGSSWSAKIPSKSLLNSIASVGWSPCGGKFIISCGGQNPKIYTTADGYTLAECAIPTGVNSFSSCALRASKFMASSPTATLISIGGGKLLRTTNGIDFSVIDINGLELPFIFSGSDQPAISFVKDKFIIFSGPIGGGNPYISSRVNGGACAIYSDDDGVSWRASYKIIDTSLTAYNQLKYLNSISFVKEKILGNCIKGDSSGAHYDVTNLFDPDPHYIGIPGVISNGVSSGLDSAFAYIRVA